MTVKKRRFTHWTITGKATDLDKAIQYARKRRIRIVRSGPMPLSPYHYDTERFKILGEREES